MSRKLTFIFLVVITLITVTSFLYNKKTHQIPSSPIMLVTMPRSGTLYISKTLSKFFHAPILSTDMLFDGRGILYATLKEAPLAEIAHKRVIFYSHMIPRPENREVFEAHLKKILIQVRDPRETLCSYLIHLQNINAPIASEEEEVVLVQNFQESIGWQIEFFFKNTIRWLEEWVAYADQSQDIKIKIMKHSDLRDHPIEYFREIIAFYGGDPRKFTENHLPALVLGKDCYRKGTSDEWRKLLSKEQQEYITAQIPDYLFERFGWER
ncbi:MAG: sulfotransferase domain-containing protein [Chlamydiales bacterium]